MKPTFFETIKVVDGVFCNLALHSGRMKRTLAEFYPHSSVPKIDGIRVPPEYSTGVFKCRVTYSDRMECVEYEPYRKKTIQTLGIVEAPEISYTWKSVDRIVLLNLVQASGCDEVIITQNGYVTDTSFSNLVFQNGQGLFTPATFLLNGTKRQELLAKKVVQEEEIRAEDLHQYDRLILINAMLDISDDHSFEIHRARAAGTRNPGVEPPVAYKNVNYVGKSGNDGP